MCCLFCRGYSELLARLCLTQVGVFVRPSSREQVLLKKLLALEKKRTQILSARSHWKMKETFFQRGARGPRLETKTLFCLWIYSGARTYRNPFDGHIKCTTLCKQKWNQWQDNTADSSRNAGSVTPRPPRQLRIYTAVSPSGRKLTPPLGMQTAPLQWHGCACYVPCVCVVTQGHFGRVTGLLLNPPCVAVVHLPEVTPATIPPPSSLRSASQQAASNCYIFLLAGVDSPYNIQRCCLAVNCGRCCKLAGAAE